jgi:hypothetical protein
MSDLAWAEFQARYVESGAYHEAGHITAAVIQKMPLREWGIHVDLRGSGISYYWHRTPGDLQNTEQDRIERELTITAIYAGWVAQQAFFPDCPESDWYEDSRTVGLLLHEMYSTDLNARTAAESELREKARKLVAQHWSIIASLAKTLWAKPTTQQSPAEIEKNWSHGHTTLEKRMSGSEVVEFFKKLGIPCHVRGESEGEYYLSL